MDGKFNGNWHSLSFDEKCFSDQFPIAEPGVRYDSQSPGSPDKGKQIISCQPGPGGRFVVGEKGVDPLVVVLGGIEGGEKVMISCNEFFSFHDGFKVETPIRILSTSIADQPALRFQAMPETGLRQGGQDADHRRDHADLLNKAHLHVEDVVGIMIKAHNESPNDLHAVPVDRVHDLAHFPHGVLFFAAFHQAVMVRRFKPHKDLEEIGGAHQLHQFLVCRQVGADFGEHGEGKPMLSLPFNQTGQQSFHLFGVTDKIVIDDEDGSPPAGIEQGLEFSLHLLG